MEDTATDYKKLYEQELEAHKKSLLAISKKEETIADLQFELEKFRKYFFGKKSEKFSGPRPVPTSWDFLNWARPGNSRKNSPPGWKRPKSP